MIPRLPLAVIDDAPTHDAVDRGRRALFDYPTQLPSFAPAENASVPICSLISRRGPEQIVFNGDYVWQTEPLQNAFRPLRHPRSELLDAA